MKIATAFVSLFLSISALASSVSEAEVIASTLYHEARGEGIEGIKAVASVIETRKLSKRWPNTYSKVCLQKKQFSCFNSGYTKANPKTIKDKVVYKQCLSVANDMVKGSFNRTVKANHYCTKRCKVYWKKLLKNKTEVGNHVFGEL